MFRKSLPTWWNLVWIRATTSCVRWWSQTRKAMFRIYSVPLDWSEKTTCLGIQTAQWNIINTCFDWDTKQYHGTFVKQFFISVIFVSIFAFFQAVCMSSTCLSSRKILMLYKAETCTYTYLLTLSASSQGGHRAIKKRWERVFAFVIVSVIAIFYEIGWLTLRSTPWARWTSSFSVGVFLSLRP